MKFYASTWTVNKENVKGSYTPGITASISINTHKTKKSLLINTSQQHFTDI